MRRVVAFACTMLVAACSGLHGLQPGIHGPAEVTARMGPPDETWWEPDGGVTWSYPGGPFARYTYMVRFDAAGKLRTVEQVLDNDVFARIVSGKTTRDEVRRMLGRPTEEWYLARQKETLWDYRYLDLGQPWIFRVGFNPAGVVTGYARIPEVNVADFGMR